MANLTFLCDFTKQILPEKAFLTKSNSTVAFHTGLKELVT